MPTERLIVEVSEKGALVVKRNIAGIGKGAKQASGGVQLLRRAIGFLAAAATVRQLVGLADQFTNIQNRLRTVTEGEAELTAVTKELFLISNQTRSSFEATAEVYARVGLAAKEMGISQQRTLDFTKSLNQAVILSGASATEAQAGLIQLSQGLASGALRGDELRSVLEQLPVVADVISKELGITRGRLRELGAEGKITAEIVLDAFASAREELEGRFGKAVPTVGQAFTILRNNLIGTIGELDKANGVTQQLAQGIITLSDNLDKIVDPMLFLGDIGAAVFSELKDDFEELDDALGIRGTSINEVFKNIGLGLVALLRTAAQVVDKIIGLFNALVASAVVIADKLNPATFGKAIAAGKGKQVLSDVGAQLGAIIEEGFNQSGLTDAVDGVIKRVEDASIARKAAKGAPSDAVDLTRKKKPAVDARNLEAEAFAKVIAGLKQETELLKLNTQERGIQKTLLKVKADLDGKATVAQLAEAKALIETNTALAQQNELYEEIRGPVDEFKLQTAALKVLLGEGKITIDEYNAKLKELSDSLKKAAEESGTDLKEVLGESLFNEASSALSDFLEGGEAGFRDFASSAVQSILKISAQILLLNALKSLGVPGLPGFQSGADFKVGGTGGPDSQIVAFRATPGEPVKVGPPAEGMNQRPGPPPEVNLTSITSLDPNVIVDAMASRAGSRIIMNTIQRNPQQVRKALG